MSDFRVKFITKDGSLVMNRRADPEYYFYFSRPNDSFIKYSLDRDCKEKGVRMVSYSLTKEELTAIVEWL